MAKTKRWTLWAENAMFEGGLEIRDVRVTFPAHMTVEEALQLIVPKGGGANRSRVGSDGDYTSTDSTGFGVSAAAA